MLRKSRSKVIFKKLGEKEEFGKENVVNFFLIEFFVKKVLVKKIFVQTLGRKEFKSKQAGAELGQAQLKLGLD